MKKQVVFLVFVSITIVIFAACQKKANGQASGYVNIPITPTYSSVTTGTTTGTTSTSTVTNPATQNTALLIGGAGWTYNSCAVSGNTLTAYNGNTSVQLVFGGGAISTGSYVLNPNIPLSGQAQLIITNAPGQPTGVNWYSKNGIVTAVTTTAGIHATFNNIQCLQNSFLFPVVTASGTLTCI